LIARRIGFDPILGKGLSAVVDSPGRGGPPLPVAWQCPRCTAPMIVIERLTVPQIRLRSTHFCHVERVRDIALVVLLNAKTLAKNQPFLGDASSVPDEFRRISKIRGTLQCRESHKRLYVGLDDGRRTESLPHSANSCRAKAWRSAPNLWVKSFYRKAGLLLRSASPVGSPTALWLRACADRKRLRASF
jgi:hypothetical protein